MDTLDEAIIAERDYPGPSKFVHLHCHTVFSPLDGVATPEQLFQRAKEYDMVALAITDHGQLAAIPDSYIEAKKRDIKYIVACEIYYNDFHLKMKDFQESGGKMAELRANEPELLDRFRRNRHLTVLAKNMVGYRNLINMCNDAWEFGFYYKPRIWFDQLKKYKEGLVILSGCLNGPVCHELRKMLECYSQNDEEKASIFYQLALDEISRFKETFGDDFYLEIQMPGDSIPGGKEAFFLIDDLSQKLGIPAVLTNDTHYLERRDFELQKCMMAISQNVTVDDPNLFHVNSDEQFFKTRAQLRKTFLDGGYNKKVPIERFEEYCDNTLKIADKCNTFSPNLDPKLPSIPDANRILREKTIDGLKKMGLLDCPKKYEIDGRMVTYKEQAEIELKRFIEKDFASYFLITADFVDYSKRVLSMPVGPGRGSAGGSLVCYALGIHNMDSLKWGLSFDRFLSASRGGYMLKVSMEK